MSNLLRVSHACFGVVFGCLKVQSVGDVNEEWGSGQVVGYFLRSGKCFASTSAAFFLRSSAALILAWPSV